MGWLDFMAAYLGDCHEGVRRHCGSLAHSVFPLSWIGTQESFTVQVNQVGGIIGAPDFRLPGNLTHVFRHEGPGWECRHKHQAGLALSEQALQFTVPFAIDRAMAGDGLT